MFLVGLKSSCFSLIFAKAHWTQFLIYLKEQLSYKIFEIENYEKLLDEEKLYKYIQESWNNLVKIGIKQEKIDYHKGVIGFIPADKNHSVKAKDDGLFILAKFFPALI